MSNPAVVTLVDESNHNAKIKRFVVEDNIGESIHLHIDNIRVDFTIKEFLEFSNMIGESLVELDLLNGYLIENFDKNFLKDCSECLPNLIEIKKERVILKDLLIVSHYTYRDLILHKTISLFKSQAFNYLSGNKNDFINYTQYNYFNVSNEDRLLALVDSIEKNGYPHKNQYIILFNEQNVIRDGLHRAAVLAELYGEDHEIEILRFYFRGTSHFIKLNNKYEFIKWLIKKIYKKVVRIAKS
jgi:hypothetical protein